MEFFYSICRAVPRGVSFDVAMEIKAEPGQNGDWLNRVDFAGPPTRNGSSATRWFR